VLNLSDYEIIKPLNFRDNKDNPKRKNQVQTGLKNSLYYDSRDAIPCISGLRFMLYWKSATKAQRH
jgi:hypothetical protein